MENNITVNFKDIVSVLDKKNMRLCFLSNGVLYLEDGQGNLYQMELYYVGSYLDKLIKNGTVVTFNQVSPELSQNIRSCEKEYWGATEVRAFIEGRMLIMYGDLHL